MNVRLVYSWTEFGFENSDSNDKRGHSELAKIGGADKMEGGRM